MSEQPRETGAQAGRGEAGAVHAGSPVPASAAATHGTLKERASRLLRGLTPARLFFGPVFQVDVRVSGRKGWTYGARFVVALLLLGVMALAFIGAGSELDRTSASDRLQRAQGIAPALTLTVLWFQFVVLAFVAPSLTAGAICDERNARTMVALLTTPLTAGQIVLSKFTSRLVQLLILALIAAPLLLSLRIFGGVPAGVVLKGIGLIVMVCVTGAALALLFSVRARKPAKAAGNAMGVMMLFAAGPAIMISIWGQVMGARMVPGNNAWTDAVWALCSPAVLGVISAEIMTENLPISSATLWSLSMLLHGIVTVLALLWASARLRAVMRSDDVAPGERTKRRRKSAPATEASADGTTHVTDVSERFAKGSRVVSDRPVLWREMRQPIFKSRVRMLVAVLASIGIAVLFYAQADLESEGTHIMVASLGMLMLVGKACTQTTGTVTSEREGRTWDVLMSTPLKAREILLGKALGGLWRMWLLPALFMVHFGVVSAGGGFVRAEAWLVLPPLLLGSVVFLCCSGVAFSLLSKKSTGASTWNFLLAGGLWMGMPIFLAFLSGTGLLGRGGDLQQALSAVTQAINPIAMAVTAANGLTQYLGEPGGWRISGPREYDLASWNLSPGEFISLCWVYGVGFSVAGYGFLLFAAARFNRAAGRTS